MRGQPTPSRHAKFRVACPFAARLASDVDAARWSAKDRTCRTTKRIADLNATFGEQLFDVAVAQCETVVQPDGVSDDLGGKPWP
jgi:hypothetical protein